jgi:hypothetical protein
MRKSRHLSWFAHMDAVYLFHDLYGYLMEMSPDIADFITAFGDGADSTETIDAFRARFTDADPRQFAEVLAAHSVLVPLDEDERENLWAFVAIKGKWNVWQRRGDRIVLVTAWGERPVQQLFLDADETKMWDAMDGEKRLNELRLAHDADKLLRLVTRLTHSDVQALKLSMMPASLYAKRPALAPPYLTSTMPYESWTPGAPVPKMAALDTYHTQAITNADEQFDHVETTLSHLFRVPHPALAGKTYGQALAGVLVARGLVPAGRVRVLEIGAGLGYVAKDLIATLREAGREVEYTIVELSPQLMGAQQARIGDAATWVAGDVLGSAVGGSLHGKAFDLILSNEMIGDLPAKAITREDFGLAADGGTADREKVRAVSAAAAELGLMLDDAPSEGYLQTGAIELVVKIAGWLAPGGTAVITEFGEQAMWPRLSTQLDHPELSTHFGHIVQAARAAGLEAKMEFIIDTLDVVRTEKGLATTRSHFRALRALAADAGVDLPKIGYTPELLAATVGDKLDIAHVGELRWDKIEDRLMGLVPHEFKAVFATKK